MKRVLFVIDTLSVGGVENVLIDLANHLDYSKINVNIMVMDRNEEREALLNNNVRVTRLYNSNPAKHPSRVIRYAYGVLRELVPAFFIRKIAKLDQYDVVIDFKGLNLNLMRAAKGRKVFWSHGDRSLKTNPVEKEYVEKYGSKLNERFKNRFFLEAMERADNIVCISETMKRHFAERFGHEDKIAVVHNAIDTEKIRALASIPLKEICWDSSRFSFCCVSRIVAGKGIERLIRACGKLWQEGFQFEMVIVGGGPLYNLISSSVEGQFASLHFVGQKDNPFQYIKACDAFVCPSETEAYPTVLCESICLGRPTIITDVGSVREMIGDSEYGLVVNSEENRIYEGMKKFLSMPEMVKHYKKKALERASFFGFEKSIQEMEDLLYS